MKSKNIAEMKLFGLLLFSLIILLENGKVECNAHQRKVEKQIIDNIFSSTNYDPRIRPSGVNSSAAMIKPLDVTVNMFVKKIHRIDDDKMVFSMDITFRQEWVDERLKFSTTNGIPYINMKDDEELWTPGLFFNDYKGSVHDMTTPNILVRLHPNGAVLHSKRYNLLVYCDMDFHDYPFDKQICSLEINSYAYKGDEVMLKWKNGEAIFIGRPLINEGLYRLENFTTTSDIAHVSTGDYPYLTLSFEFQRELGYYGVQLFMPCTMLVIAAYLPFWIRMKHFNTRIILSVATCYTLGLLLNAFNTEIPKTAYTKAIDTFSGVSMTFCFATLVETIIVYIMTTKKISDAADQIGTRKDADGIVMKAKTWLIEHSDNSVDATAKLFYPLLYILFSIVYWSVYL